MLITVFVHCLKKKRYQLRTLYYKLRYERFAPTHYSFTCYVSHARGDAPWVQDVLIPRLEEDYDFKLCVPDRDFYHEDEIVEILDSMTQSQSILIVLSSSFLDNYNCRFSLTQAFEQRRRHGKRVFAIKLGNIARSVLQRDAKALELVDGDRFVEWPVVGSGSSARSRRLLAKKRNKFWCKLTTELYRGMNIHQHRHHNMQTNTQA